MMKRIMITILAISALQANVFAADAGKTSKKRSADEAVLISALQAEIDSKHAMQIEADELAGKEAAIEERLAANGARKRTRAAAPEIAAQKTELEHSRAEVVAQAEALSARIKALEARAFSLREQMHTAADAEQVRLNEELALVAAEEAQLQLELGILEIGNIADQGEEVIYANIDGQGVLVTDRDAYIHLLNTRLEITGLESMLTSARESKALLTGRITAQSGSLLGQAAQSAGFVGWLGSAVLAVADRFTRTKAALATTEASIVVLESRIIAKQHLLAVLKSVACRPAAAHVHSDDRV